MPLFMDFHKIDSEAFTEEDMYRAHLKDVAVQNKHGLIYKRYYLNLHHKTAFCLMESPNKEACVESHKEAHGIGACNVIEVSHQNEFIPYMGEGDQNEQDLALTLSGEIDSGFRTIMLVDFMELTEIKALMATKISDSIKKYRGNVVKVPSEKFMASFVDASDAVVCSTEIAKYFETLEGKMIYSIALATGRPVDEHSTDLFEETNTKVAVMARLGFPLGMCMDLETKLAAFRSKDISKLDTTGITVIDQSSYIEIQKLDKILLRNLNNSAFNSDALNRQLGLSKSQAYRKISSLFGVPPTKLLSELRLVHATRVLKTGDKTVSEVAYDSGFNSPTYFTRVFRNRFDILPTLIAKSKFD
ncbi:nickel-binding protein [Kriegella aquimaris]|uniref:AraC-type DNA-binding protein n=1 Tax=Kriegella aquimaris TaxID=192904 RepID=A0A1G9N5D3_9FLAO|nr:nickel-binding protein [Kriegella aquimaris]SDL81055.1 AraC-type DNA-binding protein [Kriegella aquimaris]